MKSEVSTVDRVKNSHGKKNNETEKFGIKDSVKFEILQSKPQRKK